MTAGPRLGISLSNEVPVADTVAFAEAAERLGFAEAWLPTATAAARDATRMVLAYYLHRVEGVVTDTSGANPEQVETVRRAVRDHGVAAGARLVTGALIDVFAAAGDPDHVAARLQEYTAAGLRGLLAWHVFGPEPDRGLELLAREVAPKLW